jgi:hypothetical protein
MSFVVTPPGGELEQIECGSALEFFRALAQHAKDHPYVEFGSSDEAGAVGFSSAGKRWYILLRALTTTWDESDLRTIFAPLMMTRQNRVRFARALSIGDEQVRGVLLSLLETDE